uniref:Reverse transcriptase domain-containing protein n=1 Tax=Tanacetum cinerariifolium TaxID=118510 RepID=A0A699HNW1_TANCI|nr:reverse transcriptase domain-containing protein [Tanacetum cinerariifolium]
MEVAELRMLRYICDKTMLDMIPNGVYRAELEVETIINKMREGRLRWFGHVKRRPQSALVKRVKAVVVDGSRRRGRPKLRWEDRLKHDKKDKATVGTTLTKAMCHELCTVALSQKRKSELLDDKQNLGSAYGFKLSLFISLVLIRAYLGLESSLLAAGDKPLWDNDSGKLGAAPDSLRELHQLDTFYNALNSKDKDSLNSAARGNFLDKMPRECLAIIESKSKVRYSRDKPVVSKVSMNTSTSGVSPDVAELKDMVKALLLDKKGQNQSHTPVKAVEESCVTCGVNYNQGNPGYRPPSMANQIRPPGFAQPNVQNNQNRLSPPQGFNSGNNFNPEHSYQAPAQQNQNVHLNELKKVKRMNEANMKDMQNQIDMVKNELRNEMKNSIQTSLSNQTNEIKNMMASLLQMNTASTSGTGSLPSNIVANPKGELKAITTRSGLVINGPTVPTPPQSINLTVDERVEKTFMDPDLAEYTIKVPPPPVQKYKPPFQREYVVHQRDPLHPNIPYPSRMLKQKQQEKDEVQIQIFWQMLKQLHINITLADALILMPKYQKILKALLSNKEKLQELANTPLNENCLVVILKKLPEKTWRPWEISHSVWFQ